MEIKKKCWSVLFEKILEGMEEIEEIPYAVQIKEKFGGLRIYMSVITDEQIGNLIKEAEQVASRTCEQCGGIADINYRYKIKINWIRTLCYNCHIELDNKRNGGT